MIKFLSVPFFLNIANGNAFFFFSAGSLRVYINATTFANAGFVMIKDKTLGLTRVTSE